MYRTNDLEGKHCWHSIIWYSVAQDQACKTQTRRAVKCYYFFWSKPGTIEFLWLMVFMLPVFYYALLIWNIKTVSSLAEEYTKPMSCIQWEILPKAHGGGISTGDQGIGNMNQGIFFTEKCSGRSLGLLITENASRAFALGGTTTCGSENRWTALHKAVYFPALSPVPWNGYFQLLW